MATQRFPKTRYVRLLAQLEGELDDWYVAYKHAAAGRPDDWLGSRYAARADQLSEAIRHSREVREILAEFARLT